MKYQQPTFTLPAAPKVTQAEWDRIFGKKPTQTDYEISVGLRKPDGTLVEPKVTIKAVMPKRMRFRRIPAEAAIN